ncbi:beta-glucanase (GH16 family) [Roseiarcus fermentans]|uniref:Beta-glucanase (GH16 family) n=1 Tax=Roseiarcus fermentans TaxID=1473586 RepID=A0A366FEW2_9HYPH|nr:glycoside hydrolase family 16 protein [Roseiarcus fermentans]RBP12265.1 beta-glucanase (GH16 family) [Roseiarcus fermentans]
MSALATVVALVGVALASSSSPAQDSAAARCGSPPPPPSARLSPPEGFTDSDLVFSDDFSGAALNSANWVPYVTSNAAKGAAWWSDGRGGSGIGTFVDSYNLPSQVCVDNGLTLGAARTGVVAPGPGGGKRLYPFTAGAVSTYGKQEFTGGTIQISMKAPNGPGAWPALWLLPGKGAGSSGDVFEIDIQEGGMTADRRAANSLLSYHLHTQRGVFGGEADAGVDLTAGYNTYAIDWVPGRSITWRLNGKAIGEVTSAQAPIPDAPMTLILSNAVAGPGAAFWHTVPDGSTPASMPMQIAGVQVYAKGGRRAAP